MRPEEKCVSRETGEKLLAAGFPQETEHCWRKNLIDGGYDLKWYEQWPSSNAIAAPDAQEIGELLPKGSMFVKYAGGWMDVTKGMPSNGNVNEAECRAAAWLYLKENNLL